jgi:hypothetical protein
MLDIKKTNAVRLSIAVAVLALAACGGGSAPSQSGGTSAPAPAPTPSPTITSGTPTPTPVVDGYVALASPSASIYYSVGGFAGVQYNGDPATGGVIAGGAISGSNGVVRFRYDQSTRSYILASYDVVAQKDRFELFKSSVDAIDARYTDNRFRGYVDPIAAPAPSNIFQIYKAEASNPEMKLTYSSFGHLANSGPIGHLNFGDHWLAYGVETRANDIPTVGSLNYSGVIYGVALDNSAGKRYKVEGTAALAANFNTQFLTGTFNMTLVGEDGTRIAVGPTSLSNGRIGSLEGTPFPFSLDMTGPALSNGVVIGKLYGPRAQEIAGIMRGGVMIPSSTGNIYFQGAFAAARN